ncbi:MAG: ribonuclease HI [Lachnospiraceae bacterium]|nr:ribonuclease HI [Lachnospiraceae bacterium]
MTKVELYTDGACSGNPGPGGYGTILRYTDSVGRVYEREFSEGFPETTNNRMELLAVCIGLEHLNRPCEVAVFSDSQYVCSAMNEGWIYGWKKKDFRRGKSDEVKNIDLWERLLEDMKPHKVTFTWVKGHAGHELNERCDRLAVAAYRRLEPEVSEDPEDPNELNSD